MSTKAMAKLDVHTIGKANPHLFFVEVPQPLPRYGGKRSRVVRVKNPHYVPAAKRKKAK